MRNVKNNLVKGRRLSDLMSTALTSDITTVGTDENCSSSKKCINTAFSYLNRYAIKLDSSAQFRANACKYEVEYIRMSNQLSRLNKCKCLKNQIIHFTKRNCYSKSGVNSVRRLSSDMLSTALSSDTTTVGNDRKCASTLKCGNTAFAFFLKNGLKMDSASQ
jgi:hypothetical protein